MVLCSHSRRSIAGVSRVSRYFEMMNAEKFALVVTGFVSKFDSEKGTDKHVPFMYH